MRLNATCFYGVYTLCPAPAVRSVNQKPYCEKHAIIMERIRASVEKHKPLLDRLKEGGD